MPIMRNPPSGLDPRPLLLSPKLAPPEVARLLAPYGFQDWEQAEANLQLMAGDPQNRTRLAVILPDLLHAVSGTADPDQALREWERYLEAGHARAQVFDFLAQAPHLLQLLCVLFGNSPAMAETLVRDPMLLYWIEEEQVLKSRPTPKRLHAALHATLGAGQAYEHKLDALRRFHRREMLRIGARDLCRVSSVEETAHSLSRLAEMVIHAAYQLVNEKLRKKYGMFCRQSPGWVTSDKGFVVLGMGKLGGRELNYSSDVDLIYLHASSQQETTIAEDQISQDVFFQFVARELTRVLSISTSEGCLFRVDVRLRPEGASGPLAWSNREAVRYYDARGRTWERLALLRARAIAGQRSLGQAFLRKVRPFVVGQDKRDPRNVIHAVHELRTQIHQKVQRKGEQDRNVKLSPGGIRDVEFIVQTLQLLHVTTYPQLLASNTITSLRRLRTLNLLADADATFLEEAYLFLRDVEHKLQMVHELQTHTLPVQPAELTQCAIRMGYTDHPPSSATSKLLTRYESIRTRVQAIYERVLSSSI